ncbi:MAG: polysaccharide deacetylase family protein [Bacillaceae bacterium]|nr:polysaccharide deacetylase family protein [Bacillaceae bacterium]
MSKNFKLWIVLCAMVLVVSACGTAGQPLQSNARADAQDKQLPEDTDQTSEADETNQDDNAVKTGYSNATTDEPDPTENNDNQETSPEQNIRYYVNPNNFRIYPVVTENEEQQNEENEQKIVLLTFDDGPKGESTTRILDVLDKYNAKSLWFISGFNYGWDYQANPDKAEQFKHLVAEIHNRGHLIGNHTWEHKNLRNLPPDKVEKEIVELNRLLEEITGEQPLYFRAPFGANSDESNRVVHQEGMQAMNWSVGSLDWELDTPEAIAEQTISTIHDGGNILFHDKEITAEALDLILAHLTEQGYEFVLPTEIRYPQ